MPSSHEIPAGARVDARRWLKENQHVPGIRQALDAGERAYGWLRAARGDDRPAIAGGRPVRLMPLPAARPYGRAERREIARVLREQNTSFCDGTALDRFERELERRFGVQHAIAVSSGTAALHAALIAAGIGPGDEVVVPALTHVSTAQAVLYQGAVPRFADARDLDWNVDPEAVEAAIGPRTRAIVVVHLCGVPCDLDAIGAIARRRGLVLIEDAAHAHGSSYGGRAAGTIGTLGCLSFQSDKTLTTGEGGAVLCDDRELARRVRAAVTLGELGEGTGVGDDLRGRLSFNYRMGALQAALGLGQLSRLDRIRAARARNAARLATGLAELVDLGVLRPQGSGPRAQACRALSFFELAESPRGPTRDELARALDRERIDYRLPYREPLPRHPLFTGGAPAPVAERLCARTIGFRVDPVLGPREIDATARAVRRILAWSASH